MGRKEEGKGIRGLGGNGGYLNSRIPLSNINIYLNIYLNRLKQKIIELKAEAKKIKNDNTEWKHIDTETSLSSIPTLVLLFLD